MLDDASKLLAVVCMLVASRNEGRVPANPIYVKKVGQLDATPDFKPLIQCGFLEDVADASTPQADACPRAHSREAETETEAERETDTPLVPQGGEVPAITQPKTTKASTRGNAGQRLEAYLAQNEFALSDMLRWAEQNTSWEWSGPRGINAVFEQFRDYWRGVPGAKGVKADWPATWRNSCRRENERRRPASNAGYRSAGQRNAAALLLESAGWDAAAAATGCGPVHPPVRDPEADR